MCHIDTSWGFMMSHRSPLRFKSLLIIFLSLLTFWSIVFTFVYKDQPLETIHIFIQADYINEAKLVEDLELFLRDDGIKNVKLTVISENNIYFSQSFMTVGLLESDLLILSDDLVKDFDLFESFHVLEDYDLNAERLFVQNSQIYGWLVADHFMNNYMMVSDQSSYVFLNMSSKHDHEVQLKILSFVSLYE